MEPKINILTLGVKDLKKSRAFYEALGWKASSVSNENIVAFQGNGVVLCLYPVDLLAEDALSEPYKEGFRGITLAYNTSSKDEVNETLAYASKIGATIVKEAQDVFWGGYSGYFADPDGHLWEVAWNPFWPLGIDGMLALPE